MEVVPSLADGCMVNVTELGAVCQSSGFFTSASSTSVVDNGMPGLAVGGTMKSNSNVTFSGRSVMNSGMKNRDDSVSATGPAGC
jgi:hypothetical protein